MQLTLSLVLVMAFAFAQNGTTLVVLKCSWQKERITPRPSVAAMASQDELVLQSQRQQQLAAARNARHTGQAGRLETQINTHEKAKNEAKQTELPRDGYRYKVTVRNDGSKVTKSIDWDYLFVDSTTQQIVARHQFSSDETIKPGKTKEMSVLYLSPPVKTVNAKSPASSLIQQVVIVRIQYDDGSVWQEP